MRSSDWSSTVCASDLAISDSGLGEEQVFNPRTCLIAGPGGASTLNQMEALEIRREKGVKRVGPYRVTRTMSSTVSACLATPFKIKGLNYSIASACATSAHCIGNAMEQKIGRASCRERGCQYV